MEPQKHNSTVMGVLRDGALGNFLLSSLKKVKSLLNLVYSELHLSGTLFSQYICLARICRFLI